MASQMGRRLGSRYHLTSGTTRWMRSKTSNQSILLDQRAASPSTQRTRRPGHPVPACNPGVTEEDWTVPSRRSWGNHPVAIGLPDRSCGRTRPLGPPHIPPGQVPGRVGAAAICPAKASGARAGESGRVRGEVIGIITRPGWGVPVRHPRAREPKIGRGRTGMRRTAMTR